MAIVTPQVGAAGDNVSRYGATDLDLNIRYYIGNDGGYNNTGLRFTLNVPAGATINSAKLTFVARENLTADTVRNKISYQDANDPADFSGDSYSDFDSRARSAATVDWDFTTNWAEGNSYDTDDIATVIQALVNEAYWASGEHCVIFVDDDSSDTNAYRTACQHGYGDGSDAAVLTVDYTAARIPRPPAAYNTLAVY